MVSILIAAIGKFKSSPQRALWEHYAARSAWKITLQEYELKQKLAAEARKEKEAEKLLSACKDADDVVALDEKGREFSSIEFAAYLRKRQDNGTRKMAFLIGGADGLHESVLTRATLTLSLGGLTWPHLLVRGLLAEQLYRAQSILSGHPYHRE